MEEYIYFKYGEEALDYYLLLLDDGFGPEEAVNEVAESFIGGK